MDQRPALASHRDCVAALIEAGKPFGEVERAIDGIMDLTDEQKASLWLFAFSRRDPAGEQLKGRTSVLSPRFAGVTA